MTEKNLPGSASILKWANIFF